MKRVKLYSLVVLSLTLINIHYSFGQADPSNDAAFLIEGIIKHRSGDYKGAIKDYSKAIELDSMYAGSYHNRSIAKIELKDYEGALQDLNKAIELDPSNYNSFNYRGIANHNIGNSEEARLDWSIAGELGLYEAYDTIREYCK